MIEDMILAGLAEGTQKQYVRAVWKLAAYYRRAPDQLSEEEVRAYLLDLRRRGVARGTFQIAHFGLRFVYCHTLGWAWGLFGKKSNWSGRSRAEVIWRDGRQGSVKPRAPWQSGAPGRW